MPVIVTTLMELLLLYPYANKYNNINADPTACILEVTGSNLKRDAG